MPSSVTSAEGPGQEPFLDMGPYCRILGLDLQNTVAPPKTPNGKSRAPGYGPIATRLGLQLTAIPMILARSPNNDLEGCRPLLTPPRTTDRKSSASDSTRVSTSVKKEVAAGQHKRSSRSGKRESNSPLNGKRKQAAPATSGIEVDDPFVLMGNPANEEAIWRSENEDKVTYFLTDPKSDGEESDASSVPQDSPIKPRQAAPPGAILALQMPVQPLNLVSISLIR
ncbi:hypothetical protein EST38_g12803 [Candolleomyces aberdarensis]|uniref:Uncharacterized protein n=1 Tax=Candolleomyces aberdarensis TaxID=2316362 RepID=A0A4Q2D1J9_9AGAR|nr:hypothetical protein EST38_g12803 [Candolleomyces aberdarensis]